uniref:Uncharacterized protein n=1 Tax=Rhizophora mucronata TaxID=61149 RepID=A0A2P2J6V4_RHIMU
MIRWQLFPQSRVVLSKLSSSSAQGYNFHQSYTWIMSVLYFYANYN